MPLTAKQRRKIERVQSFAWALRKGEYCIFVEFDDEGRLVIVDGAVHTYLSRKTARLLAKRINQALDAWSGKETSWH